MELTSESSWGALLNSFGTSLGVSFPGFPDLQPVQEEQENESTPEPGGETLPPPGSLRHSVRNEFMR